MPRVVPPNVGHDDEYFWNGVKEGVLLVRQCAKCSFLQHPPSPMCPECGSVEWSVHQTEGRGTVHSWIVSRHPTEPDEVQRIVALIELEEGFRFVSNLQNVTKDAVRNGMAVEVVFMDVEGVRLPQFQPVATAGA